MRVHPSQLVPGCILLKDVMGKTKSPIVNKNSVLNETHIMFLQKFLIPDVDVSGKLADGTPYKPKETVQKETNKILHNEKQKEKSTLETIYSQAVTAYQQMFAKWRQHAGIDMPQIRNFMLPLFERLDEFGPSVFTLHHDATKESYIYHHSVSVGILSAYLAKNLGFAKGDMIQAGLAGLLSDCGLARLTPYTLTKERFFNIEENEAFKQHPIHSYRLVEHIPTMSQAAKLAVLQHHERQSGMGYPLGLTNKKIEMYASIIAVCDTYHAITCDRPHEQHKSPFEAIDDIRKKQFSEFEPKVAAAFTNQFLKSINGARVQLSTAQTGKIVFVDKNNPTCPVVELDETEEVISIKDDESITIMDLVHE